MAVWLLWYIIECRICNREVSGLQVRISGGDTSHQGLLSWAFHPSGVGKWVPATARKAKAGMAHSDCGWTYGCAGKTVKALENTCHTWALLRWWFSTKRRYIKFMHLYLYLCLSHSVIMLRPKHFQAFQYSFQVIYSIRTTSYGSRVIALGLLVSRPYKWLGMVILNVRDQTWSH